MNPLSVFFKGVAMGAANVIPGVSGGTIAFITGIYERLINALRHFDLTAIRLFFTGKWRPLAAHVDLGFLIALGGGVLVAVVTLSKLLEYLFEHHPVYLWAFFFGLILASILFVGQSVRRWSAGPVISLIVGVAIAVVIALMKPAGENPNLFYLLLCGVAAMASMIIPGLSGSFVLLLMGNYLLVLRAINDWDIVTLIPVAVGAAIGLLGLSHILAWIFERYHDTAVALMTGFVAGSLLLIWPWKKSVTETFTVGNEVKEKVVAYEWRWPPLESSTLWAVLLILAGFLAVWFVERAGKGVSAAAKAAAVQSSPS